MGRRRASGDPPAKRCRVSGCAAGVSRDGHDLCLLHWQAMRDGTVRRCEACGEWREMTTAVCPTCGGERAPAPSRDGLSSTALGRHLELSAQSMNLLLAELGWIRRAGEGWTPTRQGERNGGQEKVSWDTGKPYVVWPAALLQNKVVLASVRDLKQPGAEAERAAEPTKERSVGMPLHERFPPRYKTSDGHVVRSRAEALIDNWLYMNQVLHAYERRLPTDEDLYCDFYLPVGKIYIEFWGMECDEQYRERRDAKRQVYAALEAALIELNDNDVRILDDVLPARLREHGIQVP